MCVSYRHTPPPPSLSLIDVAVGCPFGGEDRSGLVLIYNGQRDLTARGLTLSQELYGAWASSSGLSGYGFTLRGDRDLDNNHYPGTLPCTLLIFSSFFRFTSLLPSSGEVITQEG